MDEIGETPRFQQKTPDQLRRQIDLINLRNDYEFRSPEQKSESDVDYWRHDLSKLSFEEFKRKITKERNNRDKRGDSSFLLSDYEKYVRRLRELRHTQRNQVEQIAKQINSDNPLLLREAYLKSVNFVGDLQSTALEQIGRSYTKIFSEQEIEQAKLSEEFFYTMVEKAFKLEPKHAADEFLFHRAFLLLIPKERMRNIVSGLKDTQPVIYLSFLGRDDYLFSSDEVKDNVVKACDLAISRKENEDLISLFTGLRKPELFENSEQIHSIVMRAIQTANPRAGYEFSRLMLSLNLLLKKEFISEQEVKDSVMKWVRESPDAAMDLKDVERYFQGDERVELKTLVTDHIQKAKARDMAFFLDSAKNLLSREEKQRILRYFMQQDPIGISGSVKLMVELLPRDEVGLWVDEAIKTRNKELFTWYLVGFDELLTSGILSPDQKRAIARYSFETVPDLFLVHLDDLIILYPDDERSDMIRDLAKRCSVSTLLTWHKAWLSALTKDTGEMKELLKEVISREPDFTFIDKFVEDYSSEKLIAKLFSEQEIRELLYQQLELGCWKSIELSSQGYIGCQD